MSSRPRHWLLVRMLVLAMAFAVALPSGIVLALSSPGATALTGNEAKDIYIVVQSNPPLALYRGGIAGLAATNPAARGEVKLKPSSAASVAYLNYLDTERTALLRTISTALGRQVQPTREFNVALNGFAASLTAAEAGRVASLPGVATVQRNQTLHTLTDAGPGWINADAIWDGSAVSGAGSKGERIVTGIIDTGVNFGHPSFAETGPVDGYVHTNPRGRFYGVCAGAAVPAPGSGCNNKLIGMYDFTGMGNVDDVGHGSHTASTVAGNIVDATLYAPTLTLGPTRISGVAPHANIISYKACQAANLVVPGANVNLGTCPLDALVAAIEAATIDVVDVINFSIGGGSTDPWTGPLQQAFFGTQAAGVFVAASAGNSGPGPQTVGQPSNAPWLMSVGASTSNRLPAVSLDATKANGAPIHLEGMAVAAGIGPVALIDAKALGNELCNTFSPDQAAQIAGKVVICTQGTIGRVAKGQNVKNALGAGMVLVSQPGSKNSVMADTHVLPAIQIGEWDGAALRAWLAGATNPMVTLSGTTMGNDAALADRMAAFSSRGPDLTNPSVIKPDVTAPGVAIWAAYMDNPGSPGADYNIIQGTSMSSPHAAGAAALVRAIHPNWNPDQVKSALMSTAFTVPTGGKEVVGITKEDHETAADPFDRGAGRIDVAAAVRAGFTLSETVPAYQAANPSLGGNPTTLNLASMANTNCATTCTWTRTITNTSDRPVSYAVSVVSQPGFSLSVSPSTFTLDALHAPTPGIVDVSLPSSVTLTITATNTGLQVGTWQFGEIRFAPQGQSGVPGQHFPVAVKVSGGSAAADCDMPETIVATSAAATNIPDYNDITELALAGVIPTFGGQPTPTIKLRMRLAQLGVNGALPPNQHWRFAFNPPGAPTGTSYFVSMATNTTGVASFSYGSLAGGSFTTLGAPEAGSYSLTTNDITWTIATSKVLNPQPGSVLSGTVGVSGAAVPGTLTTNLKTVNGADYTLGTCSGGQTPTPTATASASATPSATPTPTPSASATTCNRVTTFSDTLEPDKKPGWTTSTPVNGAVALSPTWQLVTDLGAHSASHSFFTDATTLQAKDDRLFAPPFVLTPSTQLSFWHKFFFEDGFDGGVLEVSVDSGATWQDVTARGSFVSGGYTGPISAGDGSAIAGRDAWTTGSPTAAIDEMTQVVVDLGGFVPAGETSTPALVRWRMVGDPIVPGSLAGLGWWVDDIAITQNDPNCVVATPTPTTAPTATPTQQPTATPTASPTAAPTATPTAAPTATPTQQPTASPTAQPTGTVAPTPTPLVTPTPTAQPTATPTSQPAQGQAILLLNTWKNSALDVGGGVRVLAGDIVVNSASRNAAKTSGSGTVVVDSPYLTKVVGLATGDGFTPPAQTGANSVSDPLAGYALPSTSGMPSRTYNGDAATMQPGVYNDEVQLSSDVVTMQPGLYVFHGKLKLSGDSRLTGQGVTIMLLPDDDGDCGQIDIGGKSNVSLSAPTSGTYRNLVIYQAAACVQTIKLSGEGTTALVGTTYAPTAPVDVSGKTVLQVTQLIADRLKVSGDARLTARLDPNAVAHR